MQICDEVKTFEYNTRFKDTCKLISLMVSLYMTFAKSVPELTQRVDFNQEHKHCV